MSSRPNYLDIRSTSYRSDNTGSPDLPSPKTGEIPPALSPLDAFAFQGRLLARRFEEKRKDGRRISRLPTTAVENEFRRPSYFRSASAESGAREDASDEDLGLQSPTQAEPDHRPRSHYPLIQTDYDVVHVPEPFHNTLSPLNEVSPHQDYFSLARVASPDPLETKIGVVHLPTPVSPDKLKEQQERLATTEPQSHPPTEPPPRRSHEHSGLLPPRSSSRAHVSPTVRSVPESLEDDVDRMSLGESIDSLPPPQLSTGSTWSRSHSPASPMQPPFPRSPSVSSEYSIGGSRLTKPAFNFSRPLSRGGRPSVDSAAMSYRSHPDNQSLYEPRPSYDASSRQMSGDSCVTAYSQGPSRSTSGDSPSVPYAADMAQTPVSVVSEGFSTPPSRPASGQFVWTQPAPSYIYSTYQLPRGRKLDRNSIGPHDLLTNQFHLPHGAPDHDVHGHPYPNRPLTPPTAAAERPSTGPRPNPADPHTQPRSRSVDQQRSATPPRFHRPRPSAPSTTSASETSTLKARRATRASAEITPEAHLEQGIALHERGSLQQSTYHLRLAAKAGHPTAMLLYALACRHGWGMRASQAEGVAWLRRAVDSTQLEVADLDAPAAAAKPGERQAHKAQFALGVYELGVSYLNGWGVAQDRALALRCFEIAGSWGDADALAEAGFCYTEGVGCKKDLKKAARFYRAAAAKGMSMAGNSWIYKEKYMDHDDAAVAALSDRRGRSSRKDRGGGDEKSEKSEKSEKKPRDKSRTRAIFSRKKSMTTS